MSKEIATVVYVSCIPKEIYSVILMSPCVVEQPNIKPNYYYVTRFGEDMDG